MYNGYFFGNIVWFMDILHINKQKNKKTNYISNQTYCKNLKNQKIK
jgi:hypothetical protein